MSKTKIVKQEYDENGNEVIRSRKEHIKHLADDLPKVSKAYQKFLKGEK